MKDATVVSVSSTTGEGCRRAIKHLSGSGTRVAPGVSVPSEALREAAVLIRGHGGIDETIRGIETDGMASDLSSAADLAECADHRRGRGIPRCVRGGGAGSRFAGLRVWALIVASAPPG